MPGPDYYHTYIIQHNPYIDNTIPGLLKGIEALQRNGMAIEIEKIDKVLGEGNFVLVCTEGNLQATQPHFLIYLELKVGK